MIVRAPRYDRFTVLPNQALRDERLSWKARGLLAFLLSQTEGWRVSSATLAKQAPDGIHAIRAGLRELEDHGYLVRQKYQDHAGRWRTDSIVYDLPPGEYAVEQVGITRATGVRLSDLGEPDPLSNTHEVILSEDRERHSYVLEESIPSLCADCHGAGYMTHPVDPNDVEACPRCNPTPRRP